jgi:hypothetical protein
MAAKASFKALAKVLAKKNFKKAQGKAAELEDFTRLPDDNYICRLTDVSEDTSTAGNPMVVWTWTVLSPKDFRDEEVKQFSMMSTEENIAYLLKDISRFGYDLDQLEADDIGKVLGEIKDAEPVARIQLKTNPGKGKNAGKDYQNVYVNGIIEDYEDDDADAKPKKDKGKGKSGGKKKDDDEADDKGNDEAEQIDDVDDLEKGQDVRVVDNSGKKEVEVTGTISKIDGDDITVKDSDGEKTTFDFSDSDIAFFPAEGDDDSGDDKDADSGDDEGVELEKGLKVEWKKGKKTLTGTITKIVSDNEIIVKDEDGEKHEIDPEETELSAVDDD